MTRGPITLPMRAYYGADDDQAVRRARMYGLIAKVYGSQGWRLGSSYEDRPAQPGYGGAHRSIKLIDQKSAFMINTRAAPLEFLAARGMLYSAMDANRSTALSSIRLEAGLSVRKFFDVAEGLGGQEMNGIGGTGYTGKLIADHRLDCARKLSAVRSQMPVLLWEMLNAVVIEEEWVWHKAFPQAGKRKSRQPTASEKAKAGEIILTLHKALDQAALTLGHLTPDGYRRRWKPKKSVPEMAP